MSLCNYNFVLFFLLFYVLLFLISAVFHLMKKDADIVNKSLFLLFSYLFIAILNWKFCLCIAFLTVMCWSIAIKIAQSQQVQGKKYLIFGIMISLLMLGYFKYSNFFISTIQEILGKDSITLDILLPVGISFYTFSAISYLIDIYRKKYQVQLNFIDVALYISFFPKLLAGPIVRADDFFSQLQKHKYVNLYNLEIGIQIFMFGIFKKMVLADHLGVFVDDVYHAPIAFHSATILLAVISYSLQIYFDFSGYSDMAIGISKILGFDFKKNFDLPYVSKNISEFWKRWHISLSSWFQEYLYYPLGGNRKGNGRTYLNLLIVMLFSGLWHGAAWTFVAWGGLHGLGMCVQKKYTSLHCIKEQKNNYIKTACSVLCTFVFVSFCWILFRANNFSNALAIIKGLVIFQNGIVQPYSWSFISIFIVIASTCYAVRKNHNKNNSVIEGCYIILNLKKISGLTLFFFFSGLTVILSYVGNTAFIYGKF